MTQVELAERLGISTPRVAQLLSGRTYLRERHVDALAAIYGDAVRAAADAHREALRPFWGDRVPPEPRATVVHTPLRDYFDAKGIKYAQVAQSLGMAQSTMTAHLQGTVGLNRPMKKLLELVYGEEVREVIERHIEFVKAGKR